MDDAVVLGDVPGGVDALRRAAQPAVDADSAAIADREARLPGERDVGRHADAADDGLRVQDAALLRVHRAHTLALAPEVRDLLAADDLDPVLFEDRAEELPRLAPELP